MKFDKASKKRVIRLRQDRTVYKVLPKVLQHLWSLPYYLVPNKHKVHTASKKSWGPAVGGKSCLQLLYPSKH